MANEIVPLQPEWIPELADFLRTGFQAPAEAAFAAPEVLQWKYFDPDGSNLTTRSLVARENGEIIGHVGLCPTTFINNSSCLELPSLHMIDWLAPACHAPIGTMLMLQAFRQAKSQFAIGGSAEGRRVTDRVGYKTIASVATYGKTLNPNYSLRLESDSQLWKRPLRLARDYARIFTHRAGNPKLILATKRVPFFGAEIGSLVNSCKISEIYTIRTPERLNHFLRHPHQQVSGWLLTEFDKIRGFALLNVEQRGRVRCGKIVDLFLDCPDIDLWQAALCTLTSELRGQKSDFVQCYSTTSWLNQALERNGYIHQGLRDFHMRDTLQLIAADSTFYLTQLEADHGYL